MSFQTDNNQVKSFNQCLFSLKCSDPSFRDLQQLQVMLCWHQQRFFRERSITSLCAIAAVFGCNSVRSSVRNQLFSYIKGNGRIKLINQIFGKIQNWIFYPNFGFVAIIFAPETLEGDQKL